MDWDNDLPARRMHDGMTEVPHPPAKRMGFLLDRWQSWGAALLSVVLHVLILLLLLQAAKMKLAPPEGGGMGGARIKVEFIGQPSKGEKRPVAPLAGTQAADKPKPPQPRKKIPPIQATPVTKAATIRPDKTQPKASETNDSAGTQQRAQTPAGNPDARHTPAPTGQAPGLITRETALTNNGPYRGPSRSEARGPAAPGREPRMDVDGHQIYYDVRNEEWLLDWQAQGMKELYFPLPGRRDLMVCPLEIVVRRGSGGCRLVQADDPELPNIGDARKVVHVMRVYRRGELIWKGPGVYR